jgi:integrase
VKLTAAALEALETPARGQKKVTDGGGLFLLLRSNGARAWRLKYRFAGREQSLSLGMWPGVGLFQARQAAAAARDLLRKGTNPSMARKEEKAARQDAAENSFAKVALEFIGRDDSLALRTKAKHRWTYRLLAKLHSTPIGKLKTPQIVQTLRAIESSGDRRESAHRARSLVSRVCRYAVQSGYLASDANPARDLAGALKPIQRESHPAITSPRTFGILLLVIDLYQGSASVANALKLAPYVFVRPGELRAAEWSEIDFKDAEWKIPAHKTKMRRIHIVPLARQALAILKTQHAISGDGRYVFPGPRTLRPLSDMTLTAALHNISPAFSREDQSVHGFRSTASTMLNELGYDSALIELQLSHVKTDKVAGAYDRSMRLDARRKMMAAWADYLDGLRAEALKR